MNDFDYDCLQKKRLARGAAARKRGSKSKKCTLPSDYLTPTEKKRRNGEVLSYNLSAPMSLSTFDALPQDLRKEYITGLTVKYNVGVRRLADMMGVSTSALPPRLRALGVDTSAGHWQTYEQRDAWEAFLGGKQVVAETLPETVAGPAENPTPSETPEAGAEDTPVTPSADIAEAAAPASLLRNGSLSFTGNAEAVLEELGAVLRGCGSVKLRVSFEVSNDVE